MHNVEIMQRLAKIENILMAAKDLQDNNSFGNPDTQKRVGELITEALYEVQKIS